MLLQYRKIRLKSCKYSCCCYCCCFSGKRLVPEDSLAVPSSWEEQTGDVELISVRPGSAEWNHVEGRMKGSLWAAQVRDIQRIQNKWLYRKYAIQRHLIKEKNG